MGMTPKFSVFPSKLKEYGIRVCFHGLSQKVVDSVRGMNKAVLDRTKPELFPLRTARIVEVNLQC